MKNTISNLLIVSSLLFLQGCSWLKPDIQTVYIQPDYPIINAPRKVPYLKNMKIRKGCLFIDDRNTSLCGNDLKLILSQFKKLRINEQTCDDIVIEYKDFAKSQDKKK